MSVKDEFYSLPPEERKLPKEAGERYDEENRYVVNGSDKVSGNNRENREKKKRNNLIKLIAGAIVSVTVITGVTNDDTSYRNAVADLQNLPVSKYEMYTRMDAGLVENDDKTAYLTEGYASNSLGVLVSKEPIDLSEAIKLEFDVLQSGFGEFADGNGADGISVGFSKYENAGGLGGGYLGYDSEFGVELDLHQNPEAETGEGIDYESDHIAILGDSVWNAVAVTEPMSLDDGMWHHIEIECKDSTLFVKYDNQDVLQGKVENDFKKLYLKIAGSTGDGLCYQVVTNIKINEEIVIIDDDYAADKVDFNVIMDYDGNDIESESLFFDNTEIGQENVTDSQTDTGGSVDLNGINNEKKDSETEIEKDITEAIEHDCSTCNGTGIICPGSVAADDPEGCHGAVIVDCKACNGTGYEKNGKVCVWCKGTLKHLCPSFEYHYECPDCKGLGRITE